MSFDINDKHHAVGSLRHVRNLAGNPPGGTGCDERNGILIGLPQ
jgi:hypothetical protein